LNSAAAALSPEPNVGTDWGGVDGVLKKGVGGCWKTAWPEEGSMMAPNAFRFTRADGGVDEGEVPLKVVCGILNGDGFTTIR